MKTNQKKTPAKPVAERQHIGHCRQLARIFIQKAKAVATLIKYEDATGNVKTVKAFKIISSSEVPDKSPGPNHFHIRYRYPNAYKQWSQEEDDELLGRFQGDESAEQLALHFGRQPSAIQSRLHKLGLVDDWRLPEQCASVPGVPTKEVTDREFVQIPNPDSIDYTERRILSLEDAKLLGLD